MISFIHTADIHFGVENYGKVDQQTGIHSRLLDFERALNFCIDYAIEQRVDFFLFSGDAYKTAHPTPTQQKLLMRCLFRLHKAGIPVIIIVGNHDHPLSFGKAHSLDVFGNLPVDGFYVISKPTILTLSTGNGPINIVGIPWPTRNTVAIADKYLFRSAGEITEHIAQGVSTIIREWAHQLDPSIPAVLAGHLTVSSGIFSGSEKRAIYGTDPVLLPSQLGIAPFDYVALGHLHRYQNLNPKGYPAIVYSGSIERVDFGERKEDKGFCHVTIPAKDQATHTFIKTPTRPFIQIEAYLRSETEQTEELIQAIERHDITDAVVKIIYHVPPEYQNCVNIRRVQQACAAAQHVVGIIPILKPKTREHRVGVKVDMDLPTLLSAYFDQKPDLINKKTALIERALKLSESVQEEPEI